jgi:hypothetical protein
VSGKPPQLHPILIVLRDRDQLENWARGKHSPQTAAAVGALAELVASTHMGVPVVSHRKAECDLADDTCRIEVKACRSRRLVGKDCTVVVRVDLQRGPPGQIHVAGISQRPHPDPGNGLSQWDPITDFEPYRVF